MNSHLPVGRLAERLESLPREHAWFAILVAVTALSWANHAYPGAGLAPLYIPIICAAAWALGERAAYFVALLTAILAIVPHLDDGGVSASLVVRTSVRVATYLFVAATIVSFRRSFDRQRHLALRDRKTGALNGETFNERFSEALTVASRASETLLLAIFDLDDFKGVNSAHGHAAGDAVLRTFARGAAGSIRREDAFGRIGGDEFAVLLRVHPADAGEMFARTLHSRVSAVLAAGEHPVTCSMGALVIPPHVPRDPAALMHAADQAMFVAKRAGKNACEITWADQPQHDGRERASGPLREQPA